jgi:branched-subunit amino acid aminotransferase/4-amino-4-deoxychorismate lyase
MRGLIRNAVHAKAAGLMICTISKHKAEKKGYADAMMLDWQGRVAECTGANIFFTRDGAIHTPIADCFLNGITRQTVIALARQQGMEVIESRIMPDELPSYNECFIVGSAAEVTPIRNRPLQVPARQYFAHPDGRLFKRRARSRQGRVTPRPER